MGNARYILTILLVAFPLVGWGQAIHVGDSIILLAHDFVAGELQWQYSFDEEEWHDMEGAAGLSHVFYPDQDTYLRLRITDPDCLPAYYTETKFIEVRRGFVCGDDFTDPRDSLVYPTVLIGDQCWMAKNLNVGVMIRGNLNQSDTTLIEKYCYDNDADHCLKYGGLYQWDQVMGYSVEEGTQGICPPGWHVPTDNEWKTLELALGMPEALLDVIGFRGAGMGDAIKAGGSSGFEALFGGARISSGNFVYIEGSPTFEFGYFYTSTESRVPGYAFRRCIRKDSSALGRYDTWPKSYGLSVRCVKDE